MSETVQPKRVRVQHLRAAKESGDRIVMLTAYDYLTAQIFDEAGVDVLLVGDSVGDNLLGHETTIPVTVDELIPLARGVARAVKRALVVVDLPFGSYEASPAQAFETAARMMKEAGAHAVKLEGGKAIAPTVRLLVDAGIPVMGHIGLTPQSEHTLGGKRVQGRGDNAAESLCEEALALQEAGAFAIVLELLPAPVAEAVTEVLSVPTIGIGAGPHTDGQVLVWMDMAGMSDWTPRFAKRYAELRGELANAARAYAEEVRTGAFPDDAHSFLE